MGEHIGEVFLGIDSQAAAVLHGGVEDPVTQQCVTQASFDPFQTLAGALGNQARLGFSDEGVGSTESFLALLRVEFLASRTSSTADASAARRARVCWMGFVRIAW